ncbi:MAG: AmmeMemoRadiSam system radical SAM enzyme [Halococcoides sp.]
MATDEPPVGVPADLHEDAKGAQITCTACAHRCTLDPDQSGICSVRTNHDGQLYLETYGQVYDRPFGPPGTPDPIEKKPLYHVAPGTRILSFGGASCNFACRFCQNSHIADAEPDELSLRTVEPDDAVESAREQGCTGMAWTYNEPTIYAEYVRDSAELAHEAGLYTAIVTNGYVTEEFVESVGPHLDAANVDIKGMNERTHRQYVGARAAPSREGAERLADAGIHVEVTYLTIPDVNDDPDEIRAFVEWVRDTLGPSTPVHFSRFHPDHEMSDHRPTPVETLDRAAEIARDAGLEFVYVGNVPGHPAGDTHCPDCDRVWIARDGFDATLQVNRGSETCACGRPLDLTWLADRTA